MGINLAKLGANSVLTSLAQYEISYQSKLSIYTDTHVCISLSHHLTLYLNYSSTAINYNYFGSHYSKVLRPFVNEMLKLTI